MPADYTTAQKSGPPEERSPPIQVVLAHAGRIIVGQRCECAGAGCVALTTEMNQIGIVSVDYVPVINCLFTTPGLLMWRPSFWLQIEPGRCAGTFLRLVNFEAELRGRVVTGRDNDGGVDDFHMV